MLIGLDRGHFFLIFLQWRAKLLDPDWPSGKTYSLLIGWRAVSAFSWLFEKFCSKFSNARPLQILTLKLTFFVEKHGNQGIAWREFKKGEPKAYQTDSKQLFVLKAKNLERLGAFVFEEILWSLPRLLSPLRLPTSQKCCKLKKTAQSFLKQTVNILFNGWKEPVKVSGRNCSASSFGLMCKARLGQFLQFLKTRVILILNFTRPVRLPILLHKIHVTRRQARENAFEQVTIGFSFACDWLRNSHIF